MCGLLRAGEVEEMCPLRFVELEGARDRVEYLFGNASCVAALKARVIVDANSGEERDLFAAQTGNTTRAGSMGPKPRLLRSDPSAPGRKELADLLLRVHAGTVALPNAR
jgi:hypothetical protein